MKTKIIILLIYFSVPLSAQMKGYIFSNDNGKQQPIAGAVVYWQDRSLATTSDEKGYFEITINRKQSPLIISMTGYQSDTLANPDTTSIQRIVLRKGIMLNEVVISEKQKTNLDGSYLKMHTTVITQSGLKQAACCNLSESFENSASVDVSYSDAVSGAKQIQLLGLTGLYTQIMTENIPSVRGLSSPFGLTYIPGPWMEAIQVSKGTSSVRAGYEAITGQINVEYKKPVLSDELYHFNVFGSDEGRTEVNAIVNTNLTDKFGTNLMFNTNQYANKIDHNHDGFLDQPTIQSYNIANRYKYESEHLELIAGYKFMDEVRSGGQTTFNPNLPRDTNNGYGIQIRTRRQEAFLKAGYIYHDREQTSTAIIISGANHLQNSYYGLYHYDARQSSIYANLIHSTYLFNTLHSLTSGITFMADEYNEKLDSIDLSRKEYVPGVYVEYSYVPSEHFTLMAGGRYDYHNRFGSLLTPRLHIRYEPIHNTILKGSAGKGYRSPNIIADNSYILASSRKIYLASNIQMEDAWNYGINLMQKFNIFNRDGSISVEYYRTDFINQLVVDFDKSAKEVWLDNLHGKSYANSYQAEATYSPVKGFDLTLAYRINDVWTSYHGVLMEKPLVSRNKTFFNLNYSTPKGKWQFNYTVLMNSGGRIPNTSTHQGTDVRPTRFDPYTIMNAQILRKFNRWEVYVGSENLTNYTIPNPIIAYDRPFGNSFDASLIWGPIMGRKIYAGLRFSFNK